MHSQSSKADFTGDPQTPLEGEWVLDDEKLELWYAPTDVSDTLSSDTQLFPSPTSSDFWDFSLASNLVYTYIVSPSSLSSSNHFENTISSIQTTSGHGGNVSEPDKIPRALSNIFASSHGDEIPASQHHLSHHIVPPQVIIPPPQFELPSLSNPRDRSEDAVGSAKEETAFILDKADHTVPQLLDSESRISASYTSEPHTEKLNIYSTHPGTSILQSATAEKRPPHYDGSHDLTNANSVRSAKTDSLASQTCDSQLINAGGSAPGNSYPLGYGPRRYENPLHYKPRLPEGKSVPNIHGGCEANRTLVPQNMARRSASASAPNVSVLSSQPPPIHGSTRGHGTSISSSQRELTRQKNGSDLTIRAGKRARSDGDDGEIMISQSATSQRIRKKAKMTPTPETVPKAVKARGKKGKKNLTLTRENNFPSV